MSEGAVTETTLDVPAQLVRDCPGLAIDVGGSVAKVIYRTKAEWERLEKDKDAKTGTLQLVSCVRTQLYKAVEKVKENGYITPGQDGGKTDIFTCGIGCTQFGPKLAKEFNVKLSNVTEMDCFHRGFESIARRQSYNELIWPLNQDVIARVTKRVNIQLEKMAEFAKVTTMEVRSAATNAPGLKTKPEGNERWSSERPLVEELGDEMYPCMMGMLGSGFAFTKMQKDGNFAFNDMSHYGGRTLLGLASLLVGTNSFTELVDLAEKGNPFGVNTSNHAFQTEGVEKDDDQEDHDDVYGNFIANKDNDEILAFGFGNAVGKSIGDFKREDLAAAVVANSVSFSVSLMFGTALDEKVKRIFITGGYASRSHIRDLITEEWYRKALLSSTFLPDTPFIELHFMKPGQFLGALGAMMNNVDKFISKDGQASGATGGDASAPADQADNTTGNGVNT